VSTRGEVAARTAIVYVPGIGEYEIPLKRYGRSERGSNFAGELKTDYGTLALYVNDSRI
jgi:hypothetical protein